MKTVDMHGVALVHCGEEWPFDSSPCNKDMMKHLEKNEKIVSWLQPVCGRVDDQFPAIMMKGAFYTLSLRMMKSIWRHVRLRKGFVNRERGPYGGTKLRIPSLLYIEKMRTQSRFNTLRMETLPQKERKPIVSASSKVSHVVNRVMLPLLQNPIGGYVSFQQDDDYTVRGLLEHLRNTVPEAVESKDAFVEHMGNVYDKSNLLC